MRDTNLPRWRRLLGSMLTFVLLASIGVPVSAPAEPAPAWISGRVTNADTGEPIRNAAISVYVSWTDLGAGGTYTDENGEYLLPYQPGEYRISVERTGFKPAESWVVYNGIDAVVQNFALVPKPKAFTGTVTDAETGLPVEGAYVAADYYIDGECRTEMFTTTDSTGVYVFDVKPGEYRLRVERYRYSSQQVSLEFDGETPVVRDFKLVPLEPFIKGTVKNAATGKPIEGMFVDVVELLDNGGQNPVDQAETGEDGTYQLFTSRIDYEAKLRVRVWPRGFTEKSIEVIYDGSTPQVMDFSLDPMIPAVVGRVTDRVTGLPIAGVSIDLWAYSGGSWSLGVDGITTGVDGTYALFEEPDSAYGAYRLLKIGHEGYRAEEHEYTRIINKTYDHDVTLSPLGQSMSPPVGSNRLTGSDRYKTAVEASKQAFPHGAETVVIATGENFADALGGAALAGTVDGPLLLTRKGELPAEVFTEIGRLDAKSAYVLGAEGAVAPGVETALKSKLGADKVKRLAGVSRYATAQKVAAKVIELRGYGYDGKAFVATGADFPDALGASPIASSQGIPVLLADPTVANVQVPAGVKEAIIIGGENVVSPNVEWHLTQRFTEAKITRLAGGDRFGTAAVVAQYGVDKCDMSWNGVGLATGLNFPDALSGGAMLGRFDSVMLLTRPTALSTEAQSKLFANKNGIDTLFFLGGTSAISENVKRTAQSAAGI